MIQITFSTAQIDALFDLYRNHTDHKIRRRAEALYLKSQNLSHGQICQILRISAGTLIDYLRQYQKGGIKALCTFHYAGQPSQLRDHEATIKASFKKNPPKDVAEARKRIYELTKIRRSPTTIRNLMKNMGLKYLKTGSVPGGQKGNTEKKKTERKVWKEEELAPRLEEAKQNQRVVLFGDAAHFVYRSYAGYLWSFARVFLAAPSGRKRFNVLGVVNAVDKSVISITNETYINAKSVCKLLKKIYLAYHEQNIPITLILDNARYQKCKLVRRYARVLGIELLYLPSYSPQLNIIERLWKFVKKTCLYAEHYENFEDFKTAILKAVEQPTETQTAKIRTLLSLNFQSFDHIKAAS